MTSLRIILFTVLAFVTAACGVEPITTASGDTGLPKVYRIRAGEANKIPFRILDSVNSLREAAGQGPVILDSKLTAAAATHARDMSIQNRPWHFGSDGSSPIDRVKRAGYEGDLVGETISETYETDLETLAAWMENPDTRGVILSPDAARMGFSWLQEDNGKIWWTMVLGT